MTANTNFQELAAKLESSREASNQGETPQEEVNQEAVTDNANDTDQQAGNFEENHSEDQEDGDYEDTPNTSAFRFKKGEQEWDIDEDAEFTFKADKKDVTMSLRKMRDAAAGGLAVQNRLREVAQEKKDLQKPIKNFITHSKSDPLRALKELSKHAGEFDENFTFQGFIKSLREQAKTLSSMTEAERKNYDMQQELNEVKESQEQEQLERLAYEKEARFLKESRITQGQYDQLSEQILSDPKLSAEIDTDEKLLSHVRFLAEEMELQSTAHDALKGIDPNARADSPIIREVARIMRQNPDFDSDDVKDIVGEVMKGQKKQRALRSFSRKGKTTGTADAYRQSLTGDNRQDNFNYLLSRLEQKKQKN